MGTTGYVVAGVLPEIVGDVGISVTYVARVIIMFAVGMIVDTPTMAILTLRLACQRASGLALVVFAIGHASSQSVRVSRSSSAPGC
ncbi:hypothetical protein SACE_2563 [Saccharopolyspora erythraea NRRL 2338]|uniref:Major facilitator superfamily (MFS) profile domain-containing protein n=2 Tax=Saccharopolyspora erythraea TaxID=1836 RepID=A4FCS9_SACEN|nr:hypothetical protein SACE_2563 [Saccharopolyspora erythraea NRRL 2338]